MGLAMDHHLHGWASARMDCIHRIADVWHSATRPVVSPGALAPMDDVISGLLRPDGTFLLLMENRAVRVDDHQRRGTFDK